ncbi:MAG: PKD domain-containing protein, partial [Bacteroidota bacterium]
MKTIKLQVLASLLIALVVIGCEFDLPEEGSIPDINFPEASFTADIGSNHREIVFTNTTNDEATGFIWDFGDGNTAEVNLENRDTTYQYNEDGTYEVTLTAFDNNEVTSTSTATLDIFDETPPLANFDFAQLDGDFRVVTFSNLSQNADSAVWDFGDGSGTSNEFNPVYTFAGANSGDTFDVTLRAIDELLDFADTTITITLIDDPTRPIANFSSETVGLTVFFTNESVNATSYVWDFGDGNSSTGLNPSHRYEEAGRYEVSLSAISDDTRRT